MSKQYRIFLIHITFETYAEDLIRLHALNNADHLYIGILICPAEVCHAIRIQCFFECKEFIIGTEVERLLSKLNMFSLELKVYFNFKTGH